MMKKIDFIERNFKLNPLTKNEIREISKKLENNINYSDYIKEQLKDCVWVNHPHTRLTFLEKYFGII